MQLPPALGGDDGTSCGGQTASAPSRQRASGDAAAKEAHASLLHAAKLTSCSIAMRRGVASCVLRAAEASCSAAHRTVLSPALPQRLLQQRSLLTRTDGSLSSQIASQLQRCKSLLPPAARNASVVGAVRGGYVLAGAGCFAAVAAATLHSQPAACDMAPPPAAPAEGAAGRAAVPLPAARPDRGMADLLALARENWKPLLCVALLTLASTVLKLLVTRQMGALYQLAASRLPGVGAGAGAGAAQLRPLVQVLCLRLSEAVFKALQAWAWARAAARIEARLASKAFAALLSTDMAVLDLTHTGSLAAHVAQDAAEATRALETLAFKGVRNVTSVVAGAAALASVSPHISLLAMSMVPPATLVFVVVGQWGARLAKAAAKKAQQAASFAAERLGAIRTVRCAAQEKQEEQRYDAALALAELARNTHAAVHALHVGLLTALPGMGMGIFLFVGSELVARGAMTVGSLTTVIPLVLEVASALGGLSRLHASLVHGADAAERLGSLSCAPRAIETASGKPLDVVRGAIAFHDVHFAYPVRPSVRVLDGFSLQLAPGEVFALVGASGSGKSTVAALLTRLYDADAGSITIDGKDIRDTDPHALRRAIGVVTQEPVLFSGSIADNIRYSRPTAADSEVATAAAAANAAGFIASLPMGFDTPVGERGAQLSGGQRQRVAIARVLLAQPKIMLLDEATAALDNESERLVSEALQAALRGRTCIIIAHRLSTVRRATRIGVMAGGKLVEVGTHAELLAARGAYFRLVQSSTFVDDDEEGNGA